MVNYVRAGALLLAIQFYFYLLFLFNWGGGVERGFIVLGMLAGLLALRFGSWSSPQRKLSAEKSRELRRAAMLALAIAIAGITFVAGRAVVHCHQTHRIRLDEGRTTWRAARLLRQYENPYGLGALVDFNTYRERSSLRRAQGLVAQIPDREIARALKRYDRTLSPEIREELLPAKNVSRWRLSEARVLGYKYGPVLVDLAAIVEPLSQPVAIVLLNVFMCAVLYSAMYGIFRALSGEFIAAALGLFAILTDSQTTWNYICLSATDVWPLAFCALAVLSFMASKPNLTAALLALALGCKIFPSLLFLPLLLPSRSLRPWLVLLACSLFIYGPWLLWDPLGVFSNIVLWPFIMANDSTSWMYFAPASLDLPVRIVALGAIGFLWLRYLSGRETNLFWVLAVINTVVIGVGGVFHNNYVPWASIWIVAAVIEHFFKTEAGEPVRRAMVSGLPLAPRVERAEPL